MPRKPSREARKRRPKATSQAEQGFASAKSLMAKVIAKADPKRKA